MISSVRTTFIKETNICSAVSYVWRAALVFDLICYLLGFEVICVLYFYCVLLREIRYSSLPK